MKKAIDIRSEFASFVRGYGGIVIDDAQQRPDKPKNADYVFHAHKVIAELKCIENDKLDDPSVNQQIENCLEKLGIPRSAQIGELERVDFSRLPKECANELANIKKKPFRDIVKSASSQIKASRKHLYLSDYQGLLLLANDGDFSLLRPALLRLLSEVLNGSGSGINSFVLFTVNLDCSVPGSDLRSIIWNYGHPKRDRNIDDSIIIDMGEKWRAHLESVMGIRFTPIYGDTEIQQGGGEVREARGGPRAPHR